MDRYDFGSSYKERKTPFGIFTDQAGYCPDSVKTAVIPFDCDFFEITDLKGSTVFSGETVPFGTDEASGDEVCTADFSKFTETGEYRVKAGGKLSASFRIEENVYEEVLDRAAKAFYFMRCGCGLDEKYAGVWKHGKCHTADAVLWGSNEKAPDVTGGWHDAGDYGRYVTAGAVAAAHLLYAFRLFPGALEDRKLNIPESGMPDILSEVRYELEWLLKMQLPDGSVYHKLTSMMHAPFVMPENDTDQLIVFPVSSMAAADLAAVCALAAGIYEKYDKEFSGRLAKAAKLSAEWLCDNPAFVDFRNPEGCNTGTYGQWDDCSNRWWAFTEMYALTGDEKYRGKLADMLKKDITLTEFGYGETGGLGSLAYLLCDKEKNEDIVNKLKNEFRRVAAYMKKLSDSCGYGAAMSKNDYYWGSNMNVLKRGMIFAAAGILCGEDYRVYAERQLHYILGCNALGISYMTGIGEFRSNYPHLRPAHADGVEESIPGMVVGGPNGGLSDPFAKKIIPAGTPPMKCYADAEECYSLNEVTIYWNSPAVFLLAYLCNKK